MGGGIKQFKERLRRLNSKRFIVAFTLAEVLITLGIIGVVAVMTIPNLISDIQERDWNTSDTVFIKKLEQSMKVMNTQSVLSGYKTTEEFVDELQKHFKISKVCKKEELEKCFSEEFYTSKKKTLELSSFRTSSTFAVEDWGTNVLGIQFADGVIGLMAYNPKCEENPSSSEVAVMDCIALLYDVNGEAKPNQITKDLRKTANVSDGFTDPIVINGVKITKVIKPEEIRPVTYNMGEWGSCAEVKSQYGTQTCLGTPDYYAGAVIACGGVENMPTHAELASIAQYLYNNYTILENNNFTGEIDNERAQELVGYGFPEGSFTMWSTKLQANSYPYYRNFSNNGTSSSWVPGGRSSSETTICVQH